MSLNPLPGGATNGSLQVDELAEVCESILRREAMPSCCLLAHSYGSAVASRILQQHPHKVHQLCLMDPVRGARGAGFNSCV
jgi:alpha-beta hydrolase superfamily lysophospholipase